MTTAPHVRTGAMRHYADLQCKTEVDDGGGGHAIVWETERKVWCEIRALSEQQTVEGMQRQSATSHMIYMRWQADVDPSVVIEKRIVFGCSAYNIVAAVMPGELPEYVRLVAERGVAT